MQTSLQTSLKDLLRKNDFESFNLYAEGWSRWICIAESTACYFGIMIIAHTRFLPYNLYWNHNKKTIPSILLSNTDFQFFTRWYPQHNSKFHSSQIFNFYDEMSVEGKFRLLTESFFVRQMKCLYVNKK